MTQIRERIFAAVCCLALFCASASAQASSDNSRPRVALVLEGGGALGLAHIGVIKVIEELGIPVDIVVGTSMGAIVGGFYAQGYDAAHLEKITLGVDWSGILSEGVNSSEERYRSRIDRSRYFAIIDFDRRGFKIPGSLLSGRKLLYFLDRSTISEPTPVDFDTLPRRYRAVAADLATGERVVIDRGSLADAMRVSMGIPGILAPHIVEGRYLVDGGTVDNLPVGTARELGADFIIAVDLLGGIPFAPEELDRNPLDALNRTMEIMIRANVKEQLPGADLVVTVVLSGFQMTDFGKAAEIMALGEKAARESSAELMALKMKLGILLPGEADVQPKTQTPIRKVIVEGGNARDRAQAYILFAPIIGAIPDEALLEKSIETLEALGIYEYIRVRRTDEGGIPAISVFLTKSAPPGHSLRLGIEYASTYSGSTVSRLGLSPSVVLRGMTTEDSRLAVNFRILDSPSIEASFIQPLGAYLFIEGFFSARQETETYNMDSAISYLYRTRAMDIGFNVGANPARWANVAIGLSYDWIEFDQVPDTRAGEAASSIFMGHALFSIHRFDSPILPMEGVSIKLRYDQSLSEEGNSHYFRNLASEGLYIPSLNIPFSFTVWGMASSDFSEYADDSTAAPFFYKPDLANRHFFPGPLEVGERIGSHIAGVGGEVKFQLNWASSAIGFPSFLLVQAAAGTVLQDISEINRASEFTHWDATLGVGTRLNDGFGVSLRVGLLRGFGGDLRSFIALDLGSIGY
ncbi:MAG: hypothetical protein E4H20_03205 [Spirochaetales bacterium]|nr:MAG: hypothetical protein E4H20_03205 [Spirochaetales bacterium]